jgi:hypothetical protein
MISDQDTQTLKTNKLNIMDNYYFGKVLEKKDISKFVTTFNQTTHSFSKKFVPRSNFFRNSYITKLDHNFCNIIWIYSFILKEKASKASYWMWYSWIYNRTPFYDTKSYFNFQWKWEIWGVDRVELKLKIHTNHSYWLCHIGIYFITFFYF